MAFFKYLLIIIVLASAAVFAVGSISIQSPGNLTYNTSNISLSFTFTDGADCWYSNGTVDVSLVNCTNATFIAVPNAPNTLLVFINDSNGAQSFASVSFSIDVMPPQLISARTLDNNSNGMIDMINVSFDEPLRTITISAEGTDFSVSGYTIDEVFSRSAGAAGGYVLFNITELGIMDTNATPQVWINQDQYIDDIHNTSQYSGNVTSIDGAAPVVVSFSLNSSNFTNAGRYNITINFSEAMNSSILPVVSIDPQGTQGKGPFNLTLISFSGVSWTGNFTIPADSSYDDLSGNGTLLLVSNAADMAGNSMAGKSITGIIFDTSGPETSANTTNQWLSSPQNISLACTDIGVSGCKSSFYSLDGSAWINASSLVVNSSGNHTVNFYSVDNLGNAGSVNSTYVLLDINGFAFNETIIAPQNAAKNITIRVKVFPEASGVSRIISNSTWMSPVSNLSMIGNGVWTIFDNVSNFSIGAYIIQINATNVFSNETISVNASFNVVVEEAEGIVINSSVTLDSDNTTIVSAFPTAETTVTLEIKPVSNMSAGMITIEESSTAESLSGYISANKFIDITASSDIMAAMNYTILKISYLHSEVSEADESTLRLWFYNSSSSSWTAMEGGVDTSANIAWANTTHFSKWGIFGTAPAPVQASSGSSGSGSSGQANTAADKENVLEESLNFMFGAGRIYRFLLNDINHVFRIRIVRQNSIEFTMNSVQINDSINAGQLKNYDLDGDDFTEITVVLNSIQNAKANITLIRNTKTLAIPAEETVQNETEIQNETEEQATLNESVVVPAPVTGQVTQDSGSIYYFYALAAVPVLLIVFFGARKLRTDSFHKKLLRQMETSRLPQKRPEPKLQQFMNSQNTYMERQQSKPAKIMSTIPETPEEKPLKKVKVRIARK